MAEQVLHVSFTPTGQSPIIFEAARDVKVTNSAEVTAEPGTATQVGPRLARRLSCQITCYDMAAESVLRPQKAVAQYRALEALVSQTVTIDARAMPAGTISWVVESVNPGDSNDSDNSFVMEVTAVELVGGATKSGVVIITGRIQIPRLVGPVNPASGSSEGEKQPTGVYPGVCTRRTGSAKAQNTIIVGPYTVRLVTGGPIRLDPSGEIVAVQSGVQSSESVGRTSSTKTFRIDVLVEDGAIIQTVQFTGFPKIINGNLDLTNGTKTTLQTKAAKSQKQIRSEVGKLNATVINARAVEQQKTRDTLLRGVELPKC